MDTTTNNRPEIKCRWKTYGTYRLIIWVWMLNEMSVIFAATAIAHSAFYVHGLLHAIGVIFIGIPMVYSEICIAQFTNCSVITMWDFFPLFRSVGYGSIYFLLLKTIYTMILCTWYLEYAFYAALDPPPWFTCDVYNTTKCMVKRVNTSVFQHCLEAKTMFNDDCGMKTASYWFFDREIGGNNTRKSLSCFYPWKPITTSIGIVLSLFILSVKKEKFLQVVVKLVLAYMTFIIFMLCCVALSTNGSWFSTQITINRLHYGFHECFSSISRGFLSLGTGFGMIIFLSRDISFRSPATMTSVTASLLSVVVCLMYALIAFSGVRTMFSYHGEEDNVIEVGESSLFPEFASISEILGYFDALPIWGFAWFSSLFWCLFVNLWIVYLCLRHTLIEKNCFGQKYKKSCHFVLNILIIILACPFYCSDLNGALADATEIIQLISSFLFSISVYWFYGFKNHSIDIIFMIGVKASFFWQAAWVVSPFLLMTLMYSKWSTETQVTAYDDSLILQSVSTILDHLVFYLLIFIYLLIVIVGMLIEVLGYYRFENIRDIIVPTNKWGPKDKVLFKSRKMFVPEIMTTEFLYRQVRIHGYVKKKYETAKKTSIENVSIESSTEKVEWSALTSN